MLSEISSITAGLMLIVEEFQCRHSDSIIRSVTSSLWELLTKVSEISPITSSLILIIEEFWCSPSDSMNALEHPVMLALSTYYVGSRHVLLHPVEFFVVLTKVSNRHTGMTFDNRMCKSLVKKNKTQNVCRKRWNVKKIYNCNWSAPFYLSLI